MNLQELKIDNFGRVLIPQEIRGSLGLVTGSTLALTEEKGKITLSPVKKKRVLFLKRKIMYWFTQEN
ncbi:MAG: AbrB/MazE/SpoVT family DNA-binding domain-containing protein [Leptospiraceae bacterium]|nr:AbrB/MazE/SpoVT family DNA-binding domain-containing protein [Leptospiraceae bacterium]